MTVAMTAICLRFWDRSEPSGLPVVADRFDGEVCVDRKAALGASVGRKASTEVAATKMRANVLVTERALRNFMMIVAKTFHSDSWRSFVMGQGPRSWSPTADKIEIFVGAKLGR